MFTGIITDIGKVAQVEKRGDMADKRFAELDTDKDGTVSKAEFDAAPMMMKRMDGPGKGRRFMFDGDMPPPPPEAE